MTQRTNTSKILYQHLGKLFYAIAMADNKVHASEIKKLKETIENQWLHVDDLTDEFGTDAAYQIEIVFDWLLAEEMESDPLFDEFEQYFKEHNSLFSPKVKTLIWKTADAIAASFAGKNKSELIVLAKLKLLLQ